jgi:hypothetical protein
MNKRREGMDEDKKIETVKGEMARGSSLIAAELRVQFWMTENLMQFNSRTTDHKIFRFLK